MANPNPRKRARTKQKLMDSYIKLLKSDGLDPITASAVIDEAGINRSTFYEYFDNIDDLKHSVEDDLIDTMASTARSALNSDRQTDLANLVMEAYAQHGDLIGLFLTQQRTSYFSSRIKSVLTPLIAQTLEGSINSQKLPYVSEFVISGLLGFYGRWYDNKQSLPIDELVALARLLVFSCLNGVSGIAQEKCTKVLRNTVDEIC